MAALRSTPRAQPLLWCLLVALSMTSFIPREALATFIPSTQTQVLIQGQRLEDLAKIQRVLALEPVQQQLVAFEVTEEQVMMRLALLSDDQLHQLAQQLDHLHAGDRRDPDCVLIGVGVCAVHLRIVLLILGFIGQAAERQ